MITAIIILFVGLLLVFLEFFVPGAILGTIGALLIIGGIVVYAMAATNVWSVILFIAAVILCLVVIIRLAIWKIKTAKPSRSIYLNSDQTGYTASEYPTNLIGRHGYVISVLKPAGHIHVDGHQWQAVSAAGFIEKGTEVEVIGGEGAHLIVKPIKKDKTNATTA